MMLSMVALLALLQDATNPEVERTVAPTSVGDNTPDFRAIASNGTADGADFRVWYFDSLGTKIFVWNPNKIIDFGYTVTQGSYCPEIAYGGSDLEWNRLYYWDIRLALGNKKGNAADSTFTMASPSAVASANGNGASGGDSWRFIGVPIKAGTTVPASELLDDVSLLYRLDEPTRTWVPLTAADSLQGGVGYLTWAAAGTSLDLMQGTVASGVQTVSFPFTTLGAPTGQEIVEGKPANEFRGNCLASNPFNAAITWQYTSLGGHVGFSNLSTAYWKWDGSQYVTYNAASNSGAAGPTIVPFQAFGVIAYAAGNNLSIYQPPPTTGAPKLLAKTLTPSPNRWALSLEVHSSTAMDTDTIVGVHFESQEAWDPRDTEDPGADKTVPWVLASFDHGDWTVNPRSYTHDFRPTPVNAGDEVSWTIKLDGNTNAAATVTWPDVSSISSSDWTLTLEDPAAGTSANLFTDSSLDVAAVNGPRTLVFKALRLTDFTGGLEVAAAPAGTVPPSTVLGGTAGVRMLDLQMDAVEEPVVVDTFTVRNLGTGAPAWVSVSLYDGTRLIAGPSSFTGGAVTWTGLAERVEPDAPEVWSVVYDFGVLAGGTYRVEVEAGLAGGTGVYSSRSIAAAAGTVQGNEVAAIPAPGDGGSRRCGLLGVELLLLAPFILGRRRRECR